jgi:hypothetical protein
MGTTAASAMRGWVVIACSMEPATCMVSWGLCCGGGTRVAMSS